MSKPLLFFLLPLFFFLARMSFFFTNFLFFFFPFFSSVLSTVLSSFSLLFFSFFSSSAFSCSSFSVLNKNSFLIRTFIYVLILGATDWTTLGFKVYSISPSSFTFLENHFFFFSISFIFDLKFLWLIMQYLSVGEEIILFL